MSISSVNGMGMNPYVDFNATENLQNSDFKQLFEKITGGEIAQEIRENYNVALSVETKDLSDFMQIMATGYKRYENV